MSVKPIDHYSLTTPASIYDEEAVTVLQLAGRTAAKVNELIEDVDKRNTAHEADVDKRNTAHETDVDRMISDHKAFVDHTLQEQDQKIEDHKSEITATVNEQNRKLDYITITADKAVKEWLDAHPEATTTVQDGSITIAKIDEGALAEIRGGYATPQMFGAVADGYTDCSQAFEDMLNDGNTKIFIPAGRYFLGRPLVIDVGGVYILGEQHETWGANVTLIFRETHGIVIGDNRTTISGVNIESESASHCGFLFTGGTVHKAHIENCMIFGFEYGISDCIGQETATTLWNCSFKHIRTSDVSYALYFSQIGDNNNFGVIFEDFYADNGRVFMRHGKYTFIGCNFGIRNHTFLMMNDSVYADFTNCNFECDDPISELPALCFGGKEYSFTNCQFIMKGTADTYMIDTSSDVQLMRFVGCYSNMSGGASIWNKNYVEVGRAGAIRIAGNAMSAPYPASSAYRNCVNNNEGNGLIEHYDTGVSAISGTNSLYYSGDRKRVEYTLEEDTFDMLGNDYKASTYPIRIGGGFYLDAGAVGVNGAVVTVNYNRIRDGHLFVSAPPLIDGVPIIVSRDESTDYKDKPNLAVFRVKMWDADNKTWVNNTKSFTLKWCKISL